MRLSQAGSRTDARSALRCQQPLRACAPTAIQYDTASGSLDKGKDATTVLTSACRPDYFATLRHCLFAGLVDIQHLYSDMTITFAKIIVGRVRYVSAQSTAWGQPRCRSQNKARVKRPSDSRCGRSRVIPALSYTTQMDRPDHTTAGMVLSNAH